MANYPLSIISPEVKIFEDQVSALTAPGQEGRFGVLAQHAPMITILTRGILTVTGLGFEHFFAVSSGILEVNEKGQVQVLADQVQQAKSF